MSFTPDRVDSKEWQATPSILSLVDLTRVESIESLPIDTKLNETSNGEHGMFDPGDLERMREIRVRILDVVCGTNFKPPPSEYQNFNTPVGALARAYGIDPRVGFDAVKGRTLRARPEVLPFRNSLFDRTICVRTQLWTDPDEALREMLRVTRSKGLVYIGFQFPMGTEGSEEVMDALSKIRREDSGRKIAELHNHTAMIEPFVRLIIR